MIGCVLLAKCQLYHINDLFFFRFASITSFICIICNGGVDVIGMKHWGENSGRQSFKLYVVLIVNLFLYYRTSKIQELHILRIRIYSKYLIDEAFYVVLFCPVDMIIQHQCYHLISCICCHRQSLVKYIKKIIKKDPAVGHKRTFALS